MAPGARSEAVETVARAAADWLVASLPEIADDPSLYHGRAGALWALDVAATHAGHAASADAVPQLADSLAVVVDQIDDCSLFFGLTGLAVALHVAGRDDAVVRALARVHDRLAEPRIGGMNELLLGNAGIALGALRVGDVELAAAAVTPYVAGADPTAHGVNWAVRPTPARSHHVAHGTLGIVLALAAVAEATGRDDLLDLALAGAADVVARNEAAPDGFLVAHSDPPHRPDIVERYSYGWCNGPAGDAQVFRLLGRVTGDPQWRALEDACWHTVVTSGLPQRLRPGFWDNHGRCCGTAGVLALALDRVAEHGDGHADDVTDDLAFAAVLVDDLLAHAVVDDDGARWSNHEHRADPPDLEPRPGWAMGNAGILPELLRYARLSGRRDDPQPQI